MNSRFNITLTIRGEMMRYLLKLTLIVVLSMAGVLLTSGCKTATKYFDFEFKPSELKDVIKITKKQEF